MLVTMLVVIFTFWSHLLSVEADLVVNTKHGPVEGHVVNLADGTQVRSFLGIPFAKPPTGELRFRVCVIVLSKVLNFKFLM